MAGRVFISYRHADTAQAASWMVSRLAGHFGPQQVVREVDPAPYGGDLAQATGAAVASCDALVPLIGPHWLAVTGEGLHDPGDYVRLALEAALARGTLIIPVTVDGARMPVHGELPPSLASMAGQPAFEVSMRSFDADTGQLLRVLDQAIAERQATQIARSPGLTPVPGPLPYATKPLPPRRRFGTRAMILAGAAVAVVVAAAVAFAVIPRGHAGAAAAGASSSSPASSPATPVSSHRGSAPKTAPAAKTILADDFSTAGTGWTDDAHQAAGSYTGGAYRLSVTGANGVSELARPMNAGYGLGGVTPMNMSATVDVRKLSGAPQGYGYGIAFRSDGGGNVYAFLVEDHAVAIQKWTGGGAQVSDSPDPVSTGAVHADGTGTDRLQAVTETVSGGQAVHLELWLNGTKMVDYTDHDHPYTQGYLGLYVESISDASSTAAAEFDNFTAGQL